MGRCPGFTPRPPKLAPKGGRGLLSFAPKTCFAAKLSGAKIAQEMTVVQSEPTAVDGNLLHENLQIWSSNLTKSWLICGQVTGGVLDMTAGHPSTSPTTDHAIIIRSLTLYNSLQENIPGVEWGVSQVIKLIA